MASAMRKSQFLGLLASFAALPALVAGSQFDICSDINTSLLTMNISIYQTNGLCQNYCQDDYAYAITQDHNCWCSNYAPDQQYQVSGSKCSTPCPAWPPEYCGGPDAYSYIVLDEVLPSGSEGPPSSATSTTASSSSSSSSRSTSRSTSSSKSMTPVAHTTTADGTVKTVFLTPTETNSSDESGGNQSSSSGGGLSTGAIAGIAIGVIGAVLIVAGIALFFFFRRKKQRKQEQDGYQGDPSFRGGSSGMMGSQRPEMSTSGAASGSPGSAGNRNSTLQVDPRMDPFKQGLYVRSHSHESVNTLRDDHDYSRKILRATNPDPENEN